MSQPKEAVPNEKIKRVLGPGVYFSSFDSKRLTPGLDNTRLFMRLTAGAGT